MKSKPDYINMLLTSIGTHKTNIIQYQILKSNVNIADKLDKYRTLVMTIG